MWMAAVIVGLLLLAFGLLVMARAGRLSQQEDVEERAVGGTGFQPEDTAAQTQQQRAKNPLLRAIAEPVWAAGLDLSPATLGVIVLVWLIAGVLAVVVLGVIGLLLAVAVAVVAMLVLMQRRRARRRKLNAQLPNYLGYLMRTLTAGSTLEEGIYSAAMESTDPIRGVFLSVSRQVRLGASVEDTLTDAARTHKLRALHILAMSARVNRRYGGSMRRVVASLIETIRQQEAAGRELKALTGETRFSAYVVAAIPIAISAFFYLQNPEYYATMLQSSGGRIAIVLALLLEALGLFIIWRMMARLQEPDQ